MIDGKNFFDQPMNDDNKAYENIRKIATGLVVCYIILFSKQIIK